MGRGHYLRKTWQPSHSWSSSGSLLPHGEQEISVLHQLWECYLQRLHHWENLQCPQVRWPNNYSRVGKGHLLITQLSSSFLLIKIICLPKEPTTWWNEKIDSLFVQIFSILPKTTIFQTEHHSNCTWRSQLHSGTSPQFLHQRSSVHHASRYFQVVFVRPSVFFQQIKCFPCRFGGLFVQPAWQWVSLLEVFWVEEALQSPQVFKVSDNSRD